MLPSLWCSWLARVSSIISDCKTLAFIEQVVGLTIYSPVLVRSVMGMYGGYFFIFIRAVVCIIWYGIQTFYAGNIFSVMLRCIFGSSWENFPNTLSAGANVTSKQLLTFFMAWLMEFPFVSVRLLLWPGSAGALLTSHRCGSIPRTFTISSQSKA